MLETAVVEPRLVAVRDAAVFLRCSEKTVRRLIESGDLSAYRLGGRLLRVDLNQVQQGLKPVAKQVTK